MLRARVSRLQHLKSPAALELLLALWHCWEGTRAQPVGGQQSQLLHCPSQWGAVGLLPLSALSLHVWPLTQLVLV